MHNRADCIPLLLSEGVDVTAVDSEGRSALQLACLYSDTDTVQLLLSSGGWIDSLATICLLNATISGNSHVLAILLELAVSCSNVIDDDTGYTLLHAAAAYGWHECAGLLIRHGHTTEALTKQGKSAVDVAFASWLPAALKRDKITRSEWPDRAATALLLLKTGCAYNASTNMNNGHFSAVLEQYQSELRAASLTQQQLLQQHAAATSGVRCDTSDAESADTTIRVQLVNTDTNETSETVYLLDAALLAKLHTVHTDGDNSTLLNLLVPPGPSSATTTTTTSSILSRTLSYDGKKIDSSVVCKVQAQAAHTPVQFTLDCHQRHCSDFTKGGFASVIEYLYTGAVAGVTCGILDCDKLQDTLQAAQYFNLPTLDTAARGWTQTSGVAVEDHF
eukprot:730-Heterococcus_DN1.PRE.4